MEIHTSHFSLPSLIRSCILTTHFRDYYQICWWRHIGSYTSNWLAAPLVDANTRDTEVKKSYL